VVQPTWPVFVEEVTADGEGQISLPVGGMQELGWASGDELLAQVVGDDMLLVLRRPTPPRLARPTQPDAAAPEVWTSRAVHTGVAHPPMIAGGAEPAIDVPSVQRTESIPTANPPMGDGVVAGPGNTAEQPLDDPPMSDPAASSIAQLEALERRIAGLERLLARLEAGERAGEELAGTPAGGSPTASPAAEQASAEPGAVTNVGPAGPAVSTEGAVAGKHAGPEAADQAGAGSGAAESEGVGGESATQAEAPGGGVAHSPGMSEELVEEPAGPETQKSEGVKSPGLHIPEDDDAPAELVLRLPKAKQFMRELARDIMEQMLPDHTTIRWK
jgi:hypothetical protein